jgi:hypothetical protein
MLKFFNKPIIEFYTHPDLHGIVPEPKSASKFIPEWFKKIPTETAEGKDSFGNPSMTAKRCLPLLDAMSLGYTITLAGDTRFLVNEDCSSIEIKNPPQFKTAEFHSIDQVGGKTAPGFPAPPVKFINPWVIKTAPGWSSLILPPINAFNPHFTCLAGLVDTDKYPKEINFPAIWHTPNFDGSIKAGTPLVTVIPIKRSTFKSNPIIRQMTDMEFADISRIDRIQQSRIHYYTKELRETR